MMTPTNPQALSKSLLSEYALLMQDAVLRNDILRLEEAAKLKYQLAQRFKDEVVSTVSTTSDAPLSTLIDFSGWLKGQCTQDLKAVDIERYAQLVEMAATKLLQTVDRILYEPAPEPVSSPVAASAASAPAQ